MKPLLEPLQRYSVLVALLEAVELHVNKLQGSVDQSSVLWEMIAVLMKKEDTGKKDSSCLSSCSRHLAAQPVLGHGPLVWIWTLSLTCWLDFWLDLRLGPSHGPAHQGFVWPRSLSPCTMASHLPGSQLGQWNRPRLLGPALPPTCRGNPCPEKTLSKYLSVCGQNYGRAD